MLHELLFALRGHYGGVFKLTPEGIQVHPSVPFISTSEVAALNDLCRIGSFYKNFTDFIAKYGCASGLLYNKDADKQELHGMYLKCFCQGLDCVLLDYTEALLQLEQEILGDPHLPVSHLASQLQQFHLLFPVLASTVDNIVSHKAHGGYILDILYKKSIYGVPMVKEALNRILSVCHRQLFKQLTSWMLFGVTSDPYEEFFIQESRDDINKAGESKKNDGDDEDDLGILGVTGKQLQRVYQNSPDAETSTDAGQYCVSADLLPSYIPVRVAKKILFVGESVQMCEKGKHKLKSPQNTDTIMKTREKEFADDLQSLSKQKEFNVIAFESVIDKIRSHAAEYLWVLAVEDAGLKNELKIMKDFFLLGRGELFLTFIDQAQHLLRTPVASTTERDVNHAFQQAARDVLLDNDALIQRFYLTAIKSSSDTSTSSTTEAEIGWNVLGLSCSVPWPLHIFFTPSILEKYNKVFRFLLAVRRAQLDLQMCWSQQMFTKKMSGRVAGSTVWQLRNHMAFLIDNLQYYLQVDVIESQCKILFDKINSTKDFEVAKLAHEQFLSSLLAQSFVHVKSISSCLAGILEQCSLFCRLLSSSQSLDETDTPQLETISENFRRHSNLLFRILSGVRAHIHLAQLLLRLDFNKFFTNMGGQLGSSS